MRAHTCSWSPLCSSVVGFTSMPRPYALWSTILTYADESTLCAPRSPL